MLEAKHQSKGHCQFQRATRSSPLKPCCELQADTSRYEKPGMVQTSAEPWLCPPTNGCPVHDLRSIDLADARRTVSMRSSSSHPRLLEQPTYLEDGSRRPYQGRHFVHACHTPCVKGCVQSSPLQASEEFDVPMMPLCPTTTLSTQLRPKRASVGVLQIRWITGRGGPVQGVSPVGSCKNFTSRGQAESNCCQIALSSEPFLGRSGKRQAIKEQN